MGAAGTVLTAKRCTGTFAVETAPTAPVTFFGALMSLTIRPATRDDAALILRFITDLAKSLNVCHGWRAGPC